MKVEIQGDNLVITIPVNKNPAPSKSGKSLVVATSSGIVTTAATFKGKPLKVGLNAFIEQ